MDRIVVTAALPYANGEIHLGHVASTYLPSDIFARYCRLKGAEVVFACATDDHGAPVLIRGDQEGKSPQELVDYWHNRDEEDFVKAGIIFDIFYHTHSQENVEMAQHFFRKLNERGFIFNRVIEQLFCEECERFLPDRYVKGACPYCGAPDQYGDLCERCGRTYEPMDLEDPRCAVCGSKPILRRSLHYFFRLTSFSDRLRRWLEENRNLQPGVKNYVLNWIDEGLKDWDITRDMTWGVPIPLEEAEGKVLYGWFDNHLGYISTTLKHLSDRGVDGKDYWNSSKIYHFIGKDIVYHHYLYLPAMRMGEGGFKLPEFIPTRGHLLLQGQKFSKSRGWYLGLREFLDQFPADYLRYYLTLITPYGQRDVNFDWNEFQAKINRELVANLGNFIHRTLTFIWTKFNGEVPDPGERDELDEELVKRMRRLVNEVGEELEAIRLDRGLKTIMAFSSFCNQYFQRKAPWSDEKRSKTCLFFCINAVRSLGILLAPYIPSSAESLWRLLSLKGTVHEQTWDSALELGIEAGHGIQEPRILFQKIQDAEIKEQREKLPQQI